MSTGLPVLPLVQPWRSLSHPSLSSPQPSFTSPSFIWPCCVCLRQKALRNLKHQGPCPLGPSWC